MTDKELLTIYNQKKKKKLSNGQIIQGFDKTTFQSFKDWFESSNFENGCYYCGTTNDKSFEIYQMQRTNIRFDATRGGKRGKRLELDRRDPTKDYDDLHNIVWCCYWCNNAKTNFFSEKEFQLIGEAIGAVLKKIGG